ncbi:MAG: ParB N-terminal domain-containing protein [Candidatus Bathyarchaeia archaeon]
MTTTILAQKANLKIVLLPIDDMKPHEKGSPLYLDMLIEEIQRDGVLKCPIIVDERTHVILDGMHRWLSLKILGYTLAPVIPIAARDNPKIRVGRRRIHRYLNGHDKEITVEKVITAGLEGRLMSPRSTRHFFPFSKSHRIDYPLRLLKKRAPQDVSQYLAEMTNDESRHAIKTWLEEIFEELEFLTRRRQETEKELAELLHRMKSFHGNA